MAQVFGSAGVDRRTIAPARFPRSANERNAFSHSAQCDGYLSASAMLSVDTGKLLPGGEVEHVECACWCHVTGLDEDDLDWLEDVGIPAINA